MTRLLLDLALHFAASLLLVGLPLLWLGLKIGHARGRARCNAVWRTYLRDRASLHPTPPPVALIPEGKPLTAKEGVEAA